MAKICILSRAPVMFKDRVEAGERLAREISARVRETNVVALGIPRGGIIVAREIAVALNAKLDIALSRKLGAPGNPELAVGAVAEDGSIFINEKVAPYVGADKAYIERQKAIQMAEIARRAERFRGARHKQSLAGATVIITDDGIATGATMQSALWAAAKEKPKRLIVAVPVGAEDSLERMADDADEVICLHAPPHFAAVGQFYDDFRQTEDEEVIRILEEAADGDK